MSLPTVRIRLECAMINPPKPTGFVAVDEAGAMVAVVSLEEVARAYEVWQTAQRVYDDSRARLMPKPTT